MPGEDVTSRSGRRKLWFATRNRHKFREAQSILEKYGIGIQRFRKPKIEIQSLRLEAIARFAAEDIARKYQCQVIVEDSGLFIRALKGFPGPFSSHAYRTIKPDGILRLMRGIRERDAFFQSSLALSSPNSASRIFTGRVHGTISNVARGHGGFGFDPIFIPSGSKKTFGQADEVFKNRYSHRAKSLRLLAKWYLQQSQQKVQQRYLAES